MLSLEDRLRAVPFFRALASSDLDAIGAALEPYNVRKGTVIFREGEAADSLYLVDSGQLEVLRGDATLPVAVLGPGSVAGELALLLGEPRSATVRAASACRLWRLGGTALDALLAAHPSLALELSTELGRRLVTTTRRLTDERPVRFTAVIDADAAELATAIAAEGVNVAVLPLRRVAAPARVPTLSAAGLTPEALVALARPRADGLEHVVVAVPRTSTALSRVAVDLADWLVTADDVPAWAANRQAADRMLRWPAGPAAVRAAARLVSGRAVGVAFSSGGSKTVAHIGVVAGLTEAGVPMDAVAGTSGGALVATAVALAADEATVLKNVRELAGLLRFRKWDLHLIPRTGLMRGRRLRDMLDRWYDGRNIEDIAVPLYIVASDVLSGEEVVFTKGPLADAVRASMSIPGAFDPWRVDSRLLIDGGVTDPLPTGPLRRAGYERIVASNVAGKDVDPDAAPGARLPSMVTTMLRTVNLMEAEVIKAHLSLADVVIRPQVRASSSFDFSQIDGFVAAGREAVERQRADVARAVAF